MIIQRVLANRTPISNVPNKLVRHLKTSAPLSSFYESDPKGGYKDRRPKPSNIKLIKDGFKQMRVEIALWKEEMKERFRNDPYYIYRPGETDVTWRFGHETSLDQWVVTADSDHYEGYSTCSLALNKYGKGVFSGELSTKVPKDGRIKTAGYCNITTLRAKKSFQRDCYLDWTAYNTLILKVRGDGRSYMLNIACKGYFDLMWNDMYQFVLYTRGGPYWQIARIPFAKFFFSSKGRVQDKQCPIALNRVTNFGISVGKVDGPFCLEIDYIGLEYDPNHTEEFAYELYKCDKYIAGV